MFNIVPSVKDKLMSLLWWVINTDLSNTEANLNAPFCLARQLLLRVGLSRGGPEMREAEEDGDRRKIGG